MKVAIVILNWNGWQDTLSCVESVLRLRHAEKSVFICDNASSDGSIERIAQWARERLPSLNKETGQVFRFSAGENATDKGFILHRMVLLETGRNGGYAAGNNVGIRQALGEGFDYVWILNNDTEVEPDSLCWMLKRFAEDKRIGICGSTVVYSGQRELIQTYAGSSFDVVKGRGVALGAFRNRADAIDRDEIEARLGYINGASMLVSRDFLSIVGLMQEDYFLYWEEMDWSARARGRFKLGYAPESIVYHKVGASIGTSDTGFRSPISDFYLVRSRLKFCARFSKLSLPFVIAEITRDVARSVMRGQFSRSINLLRALAGLPFLPGAAQC